MHENCSLPWLCLNTFKMLFLKYYMCCPTNCTNLKMYIQKKKQKKYCSSSLHLLSWIDTK